MRLTVIIAEHNGGAGRRMREPIGLDHPGQAEGGNLVAGFDVLEDLCGGLGVNTERAHLIVIPQTHVLLARSLPERVDVCRVGLCRTIRDQDVACHEGSRFFMVRLSRIMLEFGCDA